MASIGFSAETEDARRVTLTPFDGADEARAHRAAEQRRLAALQARGETAWQYLVETAARICETPLAGIVLLDGDALSFKAVVGLPSLPGDLPVESAPCMRLMQGSPEPVTVMKDACAEGQPHSPLMPGGRPLCFWATAKLAGDHALLGSIWVADVVARDLTPVQVRTLELLARQTTLLMEERV